MGLISAKYDSDTTHSRGTQLSLQELLDSLQSDDPHTRRRAVRALDQYPDSVENLCDLLAEETTLSVLEATFHTLSCINTTDVVHHLIPLLHSDSAHVRNGVITTLQNMPNITAEYIDRLLRDEDPDIRIFALNILQSMPHPDVPQWALRVAVEDEHINVVGSALECLMDTGTPDMIPTLHKLAERFTEDPFIGFVIDETIQRIGQDL